MEDTQVSIGIVGVDVKKATVNGKPVEILCHDPESRLLLFKSGEKAKFKKWGRQPQAPARRRPSIPNRMAWVSSAGVVSLDYTFGDSVLPLAFFRVRHQGNVPAPGQPLFNKDGELVAISHQVTPTDPQTTYAPARGGLW